MKITIKTISGQTRTLEVEKSTTIASIKAQLDALEGIKPEQQRILSQGQILKETDTMESLGAEEGSVFHMVLHLVGG